MAAAVTLALGLGVVPAAGAVDGIRTIEEARGDLADQEAKLLRLDEQKAQAERALVGLQADRARIDVQVQRLDAEAAEFQRELQQARRDARLATVEAYVSGNRRVAAIEPDGSADALWQEAILSERADAGVEAALRYQELRTRANEAVVALADDADRLDARITEARTDIERATREQAATRARIAELRAEVRTLEIVAAFGIRRADPGERAWAALRNCESHGNYATNTGNGFYGAYQFDLQTWRSMGGSGLPSDAPPWEQDARAKALYQTRGAQPWPVCGRYL